MLFLAVVVFSSCTKEPMIGPNVSFSTSLTDNIAYSGEAFSVYVERDQAQFYTIYTGQTGMVYGEPQAVGIFLNQASDSLEITYQSVGEYTVTVLASSTGNQAQDFDRKIDSIKITVRDRRATIDKFDFSLASSDLVPGRIEGNDIIGSVADIPGYSYLYKPTFFTASDYAKVYLGEIDDANLLESGVTEIDFTDATQENPKIFIVLSPNGETQEYRLWIKREIPSSEAVLHFIQSRHRTSGAILDAAVPVEVNGEYVIDFICNNSPIRDRMYRYNISASYGSTVEINEAGRWYIFRTSVDYELRRIEAIRVTAQDQVTSVTYKFKTYEQLLTSFVFTQAGSIVLSPQLPAAIDLDAKTITISMSKGTFANQLDGMVATWAGSMTATKFDGVAGEATSGVTKLDFRTGYTSDQRVKKVTFTVGNTNVEFDLIINLIP